VTLAIDMLEGMLVVLLAQHMQARRWGVVAN
jgi:hypothetical protein